MAVYGVSPYAIPKDVALGAMMNLRAAQAWKAIPEIMAIGSALGNKEAANEVRLGIVGMPTDSKGQVRELLEQLKGASKQ